MRCPNPPSRFDQMGDEKRRKMICQPHIYAAQPSPDQKAKKKKDESVQKEKSEVDGSEDISREGSFVDETNKDSIIE